MTTLVESPGVVRSPSLVPRPRRRARSGLTARGEPMLWLTAGALVLCVAMIVSLVALVVFHGARAFWPGDVVQLQTRGGPVFAGEVSRIEQFRKAEASGPPAPQTPAGGAGQNAAAEADWPTRRLLRTGNFDMTGTHYTWIDDADVVEESRPPWALVVERQAWGRFYGEPVALEIDGKAMTGTPEETWSRFGEHHPRARQRWRERRRLETHDMGRVNHLLEKARLALRTAEIRFGRDSAAWMQAQTAQAETEEWASAEFDRLTARITGLQIENDRYRLHVKTADGSSKRIHLADIVRAYPANQLTRWDRLAVYGSRWWEFFSDEPREANSEGGVFPAIFGTVLMTVLMSLAVVPFGVLAALYLREYARAGLIVSAVRIAINNLAGVPSIVFGVFGLGFFCYGIGSLIDAGPLDPWTRGQWFAGLIVLVVLVLGAVGLSLLFPTRPSVIGGARPALGRMMVAMWVLAACTTVLMLANMPFFDGFYRAKLPNPTFGKGALIWASLTLALLTLPVVIVATEEALAAVPNSLREGSYACGGSKWQTIHRIVLPRAMPGVMTGAILAMARGAGEVAPLMLVGAVKLAPELPIDGSPPFGINRSFMHLAFHIFDLGFQSQNSEAAKPMVYATTLLLILIVAALNLSAVWARARLRRRFVTAQF